MEARNARTLGPQSALIRPQRRLQPRPDAQRQRVIEERRHPELMRRAARGAVRGGSDDRLP
jgi:hypothetical protein